MFVLIGSSPLGLFSRCSQPRLCICSMFSNAVFAVFGQSRNSESTFIYKVGCVQAIYTKKEFPLCCF